MSAPTYDTWRAVPDHLTLESQLATLDLPRAVGGPVRAWIRTRGAIGRMEDFALYDIRESVPTTGSAAALDAAAARRLRVYECQGCGAHTEAALGVHDPCHHRDHPDRHKPCPHRARRCAACRHRAELDHAARCAATARDGAATWAARMLTDAAVLARVARLNPTPATTAAGRRRPALGWRIDAAEAGGAVLPTVVVARASVAAAGLTGAVDSAQGAHALGAHLGGRIVIAYIEEEAQQLRTLLTGAEPGPAVEFAAQLRDKLAAWRGLVNPRTAAPLPVLDPGPVDRCALLLRRMAATAGPD